MCMLFKRVSLYMVCVCESMPMFWKESTELGLCASVKIFTIIPLSLHILHALDLTGLFEKWSI